MSAKLTAEERAEMRERLNHFWPSCATGLSPRGSLEWAVGEVERDREQRAAGSRVHYVVAESREDAEQAIVDGAHLFQDTDDGRTQAEKMATALDMHAFRVRVSCEISEVEA